MSRLVAVTGATGFIGSTILSMLRAEGWHVRALVRRQVELPAELVHGDLLDDSALESLLNGAEAVIHCAGRVRGASAEAFEISNVQGTVRLAKLAAAQPRAPRFLLISSLAAREPSLSWYAGSKYRAEQVLAQYIRKMPCTVFRPTAVYGPGDRELKPLFNAMQRGFLPIPGHGSARLSLLHVSDLVAAVRAWLTATATPVGPYELHDGTPNGYNWYDVRELGQETLNRRITLLPVPAALSGTAAWFNLWLGRIFGYAPMLTPGKIRELRHPDWRCDNSAAIRDLDWRPEIKLADSLRQQFLSPAT